MVTNRLSVNQKFVNWYDGQQVTNVELTDEQNRNINIDAANVANFMGSGVLETNIIPNVIVDTRHLNTTQQALLSSNAFDGQNVYVGTVNDVSDTILGVTLAVTISGANLDGSAFTKVCIIGDTFGGELIHDDLVFHENGTKITRGRYKHIRSVLFNNLAGNAYGSINYIGSGYCSVRETESLEVSYDTVIASQDKQPNQFFKDFEPGVHAWTVTQMLEDAVGPDKSVGDLNIGLASVSKREIAPNDVTTRVGEKFQALGKNIQKISILLSVKEDLTAPPGDEFAWSGDIVLELRKLQTDVSCPVSPVPDTALDFDPDPSLISYISLNKDDLEKQGIELSGEAQIVEFTFTDMTISNPISSPIHEGLYYVFTIGRSSDAHTGTLQFEEVGDLYDSGYMVIYDGSQWVNITDSDMWFVIEGDYIKVADGISYEDGVGVEVPRVYLDSTNTEVPFVYGFIPFYSAQYNYENYVLLEKKNQYSDQEQDQRTGNMVYSRATFAPEVSLINSLSLNTLKTTNPWPVLLGDFVDGNPRGNPETIEGTTEIIGLCYNNELNVLSPDADLRSFNLVGSILKPNKTNVASYRIIKSELIYDLYGDVNGDGVIDLADLALVNSWSPDGYDIRKIEGSDPLIVIQAKIATQEKIAAGSVSIEEILRADVNGDGIVDAADAELIKQYINKEIFTFPVGSSFQRMNIVVENLLNATTTSVVIQNDPPINNSFVAVPFIGVDFSIEYFANWIPDRLQVVDLRRKLPTAFTKEVTTSLPKGRNDFYFPGNILVGGRVLNPDETVHTLDFETVQVILDIPIIDSYGNKVFLDGYHGIDLFETFVAESSSGKTAYGFDAMKYSDGTYVQMEDFVGNKVRIVPSIQSVSSEFEMAFGASYKDIIGLYYDPSTSLVTFYIDNVYDDHYGNLLPPLSTKILVEVMLKKAGFINSTQTITQGQMRTLLGQ
jgi:hypothetical protein